VHAPGKKDEQAAYKVAHHLLRSHGIAARAIRDVQPDAKVGIAINMNGVTPASDAPKDVQAAAYQDGFMARWFLDPLFHGRYPADMVELLGPALEGINLDAVDVAAVPLDFFGLNFYTRDNFAWDDNQSLKFKTVPTPDAERTAMGWEVHPQSLTDILVRLHNDYPMPPIFVTENGAAYYDSA